MMNILEHYCVVSEIYCMVWFRLSFIYYFNAELLVLLFCTYMVVFDWLYESIFWMDIFAHTHVGEVVGEVCGTLVIHCGKWVIECQTLLFQHGEMLFSIQKHLGKWSWSYCCRQKWNNLSYWEWLNALLSLIFRVTMIIVEDADIYKMFKINCSVYRTKISHLNDRLIHKLR